MSWTNRLMDVMVLCFFGIGGVALAIGLYYVPGLLSSKIALNRAAAKALSGLDLRDEETRRTIRGLLGVEPREPQEGR